MSNDPASGEQPGRHGASYPGAYGPQDPTSFGGSYGPPEQHGSSYPGYQGAPQAGYGQAAPQWAAGPAAAQRPAWQAGPPAGMAAPAGMAHGGPVRGAGTAQGFFGALFDLSFDSFVTPVLIKVLYILGLVVIGLSYLSWVVLAFAADSGAGIVVLLLGAVGALFAAMIFRASLEFSYATIRMAEDIRVLRDRQSSSL